MEKAEVSIGGGATIKGNVAAPADQVAIGQANTLSSVEAGGNFTGRDVIDAGRDVLQEQYDQRTVLRDLDQRRDTRHYNESRSNTGASNYNFESQDNARVWEAIVELTKTMDNLPERMKTVEAIVLPVPAPLMAAVPVALAVPGQPPITAVVPAHGVAPTAKPPTWMIIALASMGVMLFLILLIGAVLLGAYLL